MTADLPRERPDGRRLSRLTLALVATAILAMTLFPARGQKVAPMLHCIVCGERGVAGFILNVILFVPLGVALAQNGRRLLSACLGSAAFSAMIEVAQLFVPGRESSLSDVLSNTTGALMGWLLLRHAPRLLERPRGATLVVRVAAAALPGLVIVATGALLRPALPHSIYYGQWTPQPAHLEWYRGRVLSARLGTLDLPSHDLANSDTIRALLLAGAPLEVRAVAGPGVPALASLFSIYDDRQREILLLGPDRDDLVLRYRMRATAWRLDQPDLRLPGAVAAWRLGDTVAVTVWRDPDGYCVSVAHARSCRLAFSPGRGWAILLYPETLSSGLKRFLDAAWLAGLFLPIGFMTGPRRPLWAGGALLVGVGIVPPLVGLLGAPLAEWLGAIAGVGAGVALSGAWGGRARALLALPVQH